MSRRSIITRWLLTALCIAGLATAIVRQSRTNDALRAQADRLRAQISKKHETSAGPQISDEELERLRGENAEAARLRKEIATIRSAAESNSATPSISPVAPPAGPASVPRVWSNVGQATPAATFETVVWSVINGDTDALAKLIAFEPAGRAQVDALFARLPESLQQANGTPEKIFATLLAIRLPQDLSSATVLPTSEAGDASTLRLHLQREDGTGKDANFNFLRTTAGWHLVVPNSIVQQYQRMLPSGSSPTPAK